MKIYQVKVRVFIVILTQNFGNWTSMYHNIEH